MLLVSVATYAAFPASYVVRMFQLAILVVVMGIRKEGGGGGGGRGGRPSGTHQAVTAVCPTPSV